MKYAITANSPVEEVPQTAQFVRGLLVFKHEKTNDTILLLPPGPGRNYPIVYSWRSTTLMQSSPIQWTRTTISNNVKTLDDAIGLVTDHLETNIPNLYRGGCGGCGG